MTSEVPSCRSVVSIIFLDLAALVFSHSRLITSYLEYCNDFLTVFGFPFSLSCMCFQKYLPTAQFWSSPLSAQESYVTHQNRANSLSWHLRTSTFCHLSNFIFSPTLCSPVLTNRVQAFIISKLDYCHSLIILPSLWLHHSLAKKPWMTSWIKFLA